MRTGNDVGVISGPPSWGRRSGGARAALAIELAEEEERDLRAQLRRPSLSQKQALRAGSCCARPRVRRTLGSPRRSGCHCRPWVRGGTGSVSGACKAADAPAEAARARSTMTSSARPGQDAGGAHGWEHALERAATCSRNRDLADDGARDLARAQARAASDPLVTFSKDPQLTGEARRGDRRMRPAEVAVDDEALAEGGAAARPEIFRITRAGVEQMVRRAIHRLGSRPPHGAGLSVAPGPPACSAPTGMESNN